ncbi:MAG: hypothetical protein AAGF87_06335 [Bacteroidota bacterium]
MPQYAWTVHGNRGNNYRIGLFHGDQDQHVVIYCNDRVISIDFEVREEKTYSLFVDDLLCEIKIEPKSDGSYAYDCRINDEAPTPLNELKRKQATEKQEDGKWRMAFAIGFIIIMAGLLIWASN